MDIAEEMYRVESERIESALCVAVSEAGGIGGVLRERHERAGRMPLNVIKVNGALFWTGGWHRVGLAFVWSEARIDPASQGPSQGARRSRRPMAPKT